MEAKRILTSVFASGTHRCVCQSCRRAFYSRSAGTRYCGIACSSHNRHVHKKPPK